MEQLAKAVDDDGNTLLVSTDWLFVENLVCHYIRSIILLITSITKLVAR